MQKLIIALVLGAVSLGASAADVKRGEELVKKYNCASCHGADYNKPIDPSYPKLAGQHADYIAHALMAYKRGGDKANGRSNPIMCLTSVDFPVPLGPSNAMRSPRRTTRLMPRSTERLS